MPPINHSLADEIIGNAVDLNRYAGNVRLRVLGNLEALAHKLESQIRSVGPGDPVRETVKWRRLEKLLKQTRETIRTAYAGNNRMLSGELLELVEIESTFFERALSELVRLDTLTVGMSRQRMRAIVSDILIQGNPASAWWAKQSSDLQLRFASQLRQGLLAGETNDELVRRIRGGATGRTIMVRVGNRLRRVREFTGGIMDVSTREAEALVRTSVQAAANDALEATYKEHSDIIKGYQAIVTLDARTSDICISRSGAMWDLEGDPLPGSPYQGPYPGPPPWHFNCRTVIVPIVKSWEELEPGLKGKLARESPGTRASMDGQVAADLTYEDWLRTKPVQFQIEVLGRERYNLWKKGKLRLSELTDPQGRTLTLAELRSRTRTRKVRRLTH